MHDHTPPSLQDEEKKQGSMSKEEIERPNAECTSGLKHATYDKLDEDGLVAPGVGEGGEDWGGGWGGCG